MSLDSPLVLASLLLNGARVLFNRRDSTCSSPACLPICRCRMCQSQELPLLGVEGVEEATGGGWRRQEIETEPELVRFTG